MGCEKAQKVRPFFATCGRGIEPLLAEECLALGAEDVRPGRGGVHFSGDKALLYRANLWLRTAVRVLQPVFEELVSSPEELYEAVRQVDWSHYLTPDHTLAVDCNVRDSHITHSHYAALKTKDAICDQFVDRVGRRPNVDVANPMIGFNLHIYRDRAVLSLDSSGESLHKRGYRPISTKAPLNEALAAALILTSKWGADAPFADPLCGSGTLCIEAAWIALRRPPGLTRRRFGFQGWMDFDVALWTSLRDEARRQVLNRLPFPVAGSDQRADVMALAKMNARAAGIGQVVDFRVKSLHDFRPPESATGTFVCNPPYGERLGDEKELRGLYRLLGKIIRERCAGWKTYVFTGNPRLAEEIGLVPSECVPFFNGKIPCRLLGFVPPSAS